MSDSQQLHGLQPTRLLHPWDFPGKSTGMGCHCFSIKWVYLSFSPLLFTFLLFTAICKASSDSHFAFLHFLFLGMVLIPVSCKVSQTSIHVHQNFVVLYVFYQIYTQEFHFWGTNIIGIVFLIPNNPVVHCWYIRKQ